MRRVKPKSIEPCVATTSPADARCDDLYCITWIDGPVRRAWYVGVVRQGIHASRIFTVGQGASKEDVLRAAQDWRDEVLKHSQPMTALQRRSVVRSNSPSGIPGVRRSVRESKAVYWMATLHKVGHKARRAAFPVDTFGEDGARDLAIEARRRFLLETGEHNTYAVSPHAQALCEQLFGAASKWAGDSMPLAWDKQAAQQQQRERLRQSGLLPQPRPPAVRAKVSRHTFADTGAIWQATIRRADGIRQHRRFTVSVHGESGAKRLAEEALVKMCRKHRIKIK